MPPLGTPRLGSPTPAPLSPMQQVASSCLRCCTLRPSPPVGSLLLCPCPAITPSPLAQGCSPLTRGQGLAFTSGILLLWKRGPLGFLAASCSAVPPPLPPWGWGGAGRECSQSSFAFLRTGLHTPVWGAGLCLSSLCPGSPPLSLLQPEWNSQLWCGTMRGVPNLPMPKAMPGTRELGWCQQRPPGRDGILELSGFPTGRAALSDTVSSRPERERGSRGYGGCLRILPVKRQLQASPRAEAGEVRSSSSCRAPGWGPRPSLHLMGLQGPTLICLRGSHPCPPKNPRFRFRLSWLESRQTRTTRHLENFLWLPSGERFSSPFPVPTFEQAESPGLLLLSSEEGGGGGGVSPSPLLGLSLAD